LRREANSKSRETRCAKIDADVEERNSELLQRWLTQSIIISSFISVELSTYRVGTIPTAYYIPNWITDEDEHALLGVVSRCPTDKWVQLKTRRLQNHGGIVRAGMVSEPLPPWLQVVCSRLVDNGLFPAEFPPNHVLINEYLPGQGIMAHKDGPLYLNWAVILSLGSGADFEFLLHPGADPEQTLYLERRSVLIFSDELYTNWLHRVTHSNPLTTSIQ
jgi:alkylated DNA repair dioxygenase AlkB